MKRQVLIRLHDGSQINYIGYDMNVDAIASDMRDRGIDVITLVDVGGTDTIQMIHKNLIQILTFGAPFNDDHDS